MTCSNSGCEGELYARGWCRRCYYRWYRNKGDDEFTRSYQQHGLTGHPLYDVWNDARQRCSNPNHPGWVNYGGRGIAVCAEWREDFAQFLADVGERPPDPPDWPSSVSFWSLDRIDNDGDYEPSNVRWADPITQRRNQRASTHCPGCQCDDATPYPPVNATLPIPITEIEHREKKEAA